jgi:hypothetical protein
MYGDFENDLECRDSYVCSLLFDERMNYIGIVFESNSGTE